MVLKVPQKKIFFGPNLKNLLENKLSIRVRNFAPLNEPRNVEEIVFLFLPPNHLPRTLWCKNQENPSDRKSHTWAPFTTEHYILEYDLE